MKVVIDMKNKVIDTIRFIVGVLTIILVFIFKDSLSIVGLIAGVGVSLYGVCSFLLGDKLGCVLLSLGLSLISSLGLYKLDVLPEFEAITFFICLSMILIVILAFIFEYINDKEMKKIHSLEVEAEVIDLLKNPNTNKEFYQPLYQYEINDVVMEVGMPGFLEKNLPKLGDKLKIYVNPEDNLDVYFEKNKSEKLYMFSIGLFFLIASIVIIITLFI